MQFEPDEIAELARSLAPLVADELERRLSETPQWSMSIPEAASWARLEEHVIRKAIADGRLPVVRIGRSIRIKQSDLFKARPNGQQPEQDDGA